MKLSNIQIGYINTAIQFLKDNNITDAITYIKKVYETTTDTNVDINLTSVEVPQVVCYYFKPTFNISEDIVIPLYITDYINSDYLFEDNSKTFTLKVSFNGSESTQTVGIGDFSLNLGKASSTGANYAIITCTDNITGMESYEQYVPFIVTDESYDITDSNTYYMTTNDLNTYSIKNDDSKVAEDLISTRKGLTQFFSDKASEGYKKIVLLENSIFRMDYSTVSGDGTPIIIPSNTTIDMNGSTFRIHPQSEKTSVGNYIISNGGNSNTCLENGTLQGSYKYDDTLEGDDWDTFPYHNDSGDIILESAGSYNFSGGMNNTLRNMTVKNIQGYSITLNQGTKHGADWLTINSETCKPCYIKNGVEIYNPDMLTTNITKIPTPVKNYGNMCFNRYKGYAGYKGRNGIEFFHWYDNDQNYIKTTKGHQFRVNIIPENAYYVRVTLFYTLTDDTNDSAYFQSLDFPTHVNIENVTSMNTRTCAITSSDYSFVRIYNCTFDNCGRNITPCLLDLEDGYEYGHNLYIDNCNVINSPSTIDLVCQYADNLIIENCTNMSVSFGKTRNVTFRNNQISKTAIFKKQYILYHGYRRIYNNIFKDAVEINNYDTTNTDLCFLRVIKDNELHGMITCFNAEYGNDKIIGGSIIDGNIGSGLFENVIVESGSVNSSPNKKIFDNCIFKCSFPGNDYTYIKNSTFTVPTLLSGNLENCTFEQNVCVNNFVTSCVIKNCGEINYTTRVDNKGVYGERFVSTGEGYATDIVIENCTINYNATSGSLVGIDDQRNKYANTHSTTFKNCIINMADGTNLMNGYYDLSQGWIPTDIGYTLNFINCTINGNYSERGNRLVGYEDRYIINYITE